MKTPHLLRSTFLALLIATVAFPQSITRQEQLKKYEEALAAHRAAGERAEEATALTNIGMVYNQLGQRVKALEYLNQALSLHRVVGNRKEEARTFIYLGFTSSGLVEREKALDYFTQALRISESIGDTAGEAAGLWASAGMYGAFGDLEKSLDLLNLALVKSRAAGDRGRELQALGSIASTYNLLGDGPRALEYFNEVLPRHRAINDRYSEGLTLLNIGVVYAGLKDWQKALEYFEQALPIMKSVDDWRWTKAMVLTCIGQAHNGLRNPQLALEYLNEALPLHQSLKNQSWEGHTLVALGAVYDSMGQPDKALEYFKRALAHNRTFSNHGGQATCLLRIARIERNRGNLSEARQSAEEALDILESLRAKVFGQEQRSTLFASRRDYYEFYVDLLMRLEEKTPGAGHAAEALKVSELAHARSLLETLTESRANIRQGVDAELLERERALQRQINEEELRRVRLLKGKQSPDDVQASERRVSQLLEEYSRLQSEIRLRSPRYSALNRPVPLTLREIQQQVIDDKTMLLEYSLGEEKSYLWVVTQSELKTFALPKRSVIEAAARRAYDLLMVSNKTQARRSAELALAELGRMVLGPAVGLLNKERLVIVADGALEYVPFTALPIASASRGAYEPLIARYEVVSLPSASVLSALRREQSNRVRAPEALAVLADAVFQSDDARVVKARDNAHASAGGQVTTPSTLMRSAGEVGVLNFERLPFSRREADVIVAKAGEPRSLKALDFAASRETLFNSKLDQYRIVHFATHGLLNSQHPSLSGIVLSLYDEQGGPIDGFLRAHEIYNLKLNAELVVLSACRTALGREIKGEGLVGLTRGFMYAGTPSVVASLWDVRDQATSELMSRFYEGMFKEGKRPSAALRAAQLSLWKEKRWTAPYFWAGFVLQGEWR